VGHWDRSGDADWLESSARKFARSVLDVESGSRQDPASVRDVGDLVLGGLDAWVSDAPRDACEFFELALYRVDVAQGAGLLRDMAVPYTLCLLHSGRAAEAEKIARESLEVAVIRGLRQLELQAAAVLSMLLSSQQRSEEAQAILDDALARNDTVNFDINRFSDVLLHQARSALLAARGDIDGAYAVAQAVFDPDGSPRHPWSAFQSLSVLTTLEARRGERGVALRLAGTLHAASGKVSEYAQFTLDRAQALFGAEEKAERYFDAVLSNPATDQWAVCAAIANADYGVWLRRKRRDREARDHLRAAKTFFERENMRQQAAWMTEELRAAGVGPGFGADQQNVLAGLSEHQREILRLAADGMRNSEIAERLYLSPHTVRSHLYRLYPKLGVTDRQQLRDLLATILDAAPASPPS
jgi:ATP/maltotriose-dependent transcriptional regulator MalT